MKTVLVLGFLLCAASAAPAEVQEQTAEGLVHTEAAVETLKEDPAAAPEMESRTVAEAEEAPAPRNARFNFCPDGWFSNEFRCYKFVRISKSWYDAEEHCNGLGGNLASVADARVYSFLQQMTQAAGQSVAWLGGFNLQGRWMWIDREGFYYSKWYSHNTSYTSYPCILLSSTNGWSNTRCSSGYNFICSRNPFNC